MLLKKEDYEALGESGVRMLQENQYNEWKAYILNPQG